jgi:hypothetical protein
MFVNNFGDFGENVFKKIFSKGPQITLTLPVKRGMSFWPIMIIPKTLTGAERVSAIEHEKTHMSRQGPLGISWYLLYAFDKDFRWREERKAIESEIRSLQKQGANINYDQIINTAYKKYNHMASFEAIKLFVSNLRDSNPYMRVQPIIPMIGK